MAAYSPANLAGFNHRAYLDANPGIEGWAIGEGRAIEGDEESLREFAWMHATEWVNADITPYLM